MNDSLDAMRQMLAGELTMMAAYDRLLGRFPSNDLYLRQQLEECQRSHHMRADILRQELEDQGIGTDAITCDTATVPQFIAAIADGNEQQARLRLVELETARMLHYRNSLDQLDFDVRDLVMYDLLPEQERTRAITSYLQDGSEGIAPKVKMKAKVDVVPDEAQELVRQHCTGPYETRAFLLGIAECESDVTTSFTYPLIETYDSGRDVGRRLNGLDD